LQLGEFAKAADDLSQAIEFGSRDVDVDLCYRGYVYERMAARQKKSDPQAWTELLNKAGADFAAADKKNPQNADADYLLAEYCTQLDDYKGAIAAYDNAIQKAPKWPNPWVFSLKNAYYYRGTCYLRTGDLKEAGDDFSRTLALPGDLPAGPGGTAQVLHKLATEFAKQKQFPDAVKWNQQAIALMPDEATKEQFRAAQKGWKEGAP
jgi:tetratricopeptide (TPR) repeat protein